MCPCRRRQKQRGIGVQIPAEQAVLEDGRRTSACTPQAGESRFQNMQTLIDAGRG